MGAGLMRALTRRPDWRQQLAAFIADIRAKPFVWGDHDCGPAFTGRAVAVMTGEDLTRGFRRYSTLKGAVTAMRAAGFDNLGDLVASLLPEVHWSQAQVGDVAAFGTESALGYALGIVNGERVLVLREDGIGTMDLAAADRVFRVG